MVQDKITTMLVAHLTQGGLCNRLRTMVSAKILADELGREFMVSWIPHETCNCQATDLFKDIPTIDLDAFSERKILGFDFPDTCTIENIEAQKHTDKVIVVHSLREFKPSRMPDSEYLNRFKAELQMLKPLAEIERYVLPNAESMIGLQIRRGDHWRATRYSPLAIFQRVIEGYLKNDPDTQFFYALTRYG